MNHNLADDVKDKSFEKILERNKPDMVSNIADSLNVKFDDVKVSKESNLGKTADAYQDSKTWDGFGKFLATVQSEPQLSRDELIREKFKYLRRLEDLESKELHLQKNIIWILPYQKCKVNMK